MAKPIVTARILRRLLNSGVYVRAVTGDLEVEKIYADIRERHATEELGTARRKVYHERSVWPLGFGLLCLALEACVSERGRRTAMVVLVAGACVAAGPARTNADDVARGLAAYDAEEYPAAIEALAAAQEADPGDARIAFDLGAAHYQAGEHDAAATWFETAVATTEDAALRAHALYNAGNAYAQLYQFDRAAEAYDRVLHIDPADTDAKANLELIRRLIEEREQEQEDREDEADEQQEGDEKQEDGEKQQEGDENKQPDDSAGNDPKTQQQQEPSSADQQKTPKQPADGESDAAAKEQRAPEPSQGGEAAPGAMTRAEAAEWLRQLPAEDAEAIKEFWRRQQPHPTGPRRRDW